MPKHNLFSNGGHLCIFGIGHYYGRFFGNHSIKIAPPQLSGVLPMKEWTSYIHVSTEISTEAPQRGRTDKSLQ